ncbi:MAG: hypothetical protein WCI03_14580 [bacterium]
MTTPAAVSTLRTLLTAQRLAAVATQQNGDPYTSLVAFVTLCCAQHKMTCAQL